MIPRLLSLAAVALAVLISTPSAEAGHGHLSITYRSGYASCGSPIYTTRYVRGYDCYRRPIYGYYRHPVSSRGSSCGVRTHSTYSHNRGSSCNSSRGVTHRSHRSYSPRIVVSSRSYPSRSNYRGRSYSSRGRCR